MKLLDLTGVNGKQVMLKPNFNSADITPGSTHNDTLLQFVYELHEWGARGITLGESSGPTNTKRVMENKGIFDMADELDFGIVNYDDISDKEWINYPREGTHWPGGYYLPEHGVKAEYNVSTCCLKTHQYGGVFTMSLKLSVGLTRKSIRSTDPRRTMHRSSDMRRMIAELNEGYSPQLIVLNGIDAFVDGGPSEGELKKADVVIAGPGQIEIVTPDDESRAYANVLKPILAQG